jgi:hypothetical protein
VFGSGIGDRLALGEAEGDGEVAGDGEATAVALAPTVGLAPVAVGVGVASAALPPHAAASRVAARRRGLITGVSICPEDDRRVSGVPMNAYVERTTCRE